MLLPLQKGIVYGPIESRRLGSSLGVNVLPPEKKICTFNCAYCQYGWTHAHRNVIKPEDRLPSVEQVLESVEKALRAMEPKPAYITFSGNGEPTLHPAFDQLVEGIIELRNRLAPRARTAILSNSTQATDPRTREILSKLDLRMMKLEAGNELVFHRYNRPCPGVTLEGIVSGLRSMEDVTVQVLFSAGPGGNYEPRHLLEWLDRIELVRPKHVQLYTLDRPSPSRSLRALKKQELAAIRDELLKRNISTAVYGGNT